MGFLLNSQQDPLQAIKSSLGYPFSAGELAVQDIPAEPYPGLPGNESVSG